MNKRFFIIVGIVTGCFILAFAVIKTAPKPLKKPYQVQIPLVEVGEFTALSSRPTWQGGGSVNGNLSANLAIEVSGQIKRIHPSAVPGGFISKGTELAVIDDANYQLAVEQKQAMVVQAQSSLDIEFAQVENAKKDYQRSGIQLNAAGKALALRQPQLASAKAALTIAKSQLEKAKLDLEKTKLVMPFDGHILSQKLAVGAYVNANTPVFEILSADQYWVEIKVPQDFIAVLDQKHTAKVSTLNGLREREATILNVLPQLGVNDRQARILLSIENPLALDRNQKERDGVAYAGEQLEQSNKKLNPIRYNEYVNVTLYGQLFKDISLIKTDALNDDQTIWVVDDKSQLQQRDVTVMYSGREQSWVKIQTQPNDKVLLSRVVSEKSGQQVRVKMEENPSTTLGAVNP